MFSDTLRQDLVHGAAHTEVVLVEADPGSREQVGHAAQVGTRIGHRLGVELSFQDAQVVAIGEQGLQPGSELHTAGRGFRPPVFWLYPVRKIDAGKSSRRFAWGVGDPFAVGAALRE